MSRVSDSDGALPGRQKYFGITVKKNKDGTSSDYKAEQLLQTD